MVTGQLAFRALFNWTHPSMYISTLVVGPALQLVFFVYLGREAGILSVRDLVVGNAVLAASASCVFGGVMAVSNERRYGTLPHVLLSPRSTTYLFLPRALPFAANGMLNAVVTLAVGVALFGPSVVGSGLPALLIALIVSSLGCAYFGLFLGAIGLRFRDVFVTANIAALVLLLVTGINVPRNLLPEWLEVAGAFAPLTHGAAAARAAADGAAWSFIRGSLALELAVAATWAVAAAVLLQILQLASRRKGALDAI